MANGDGDGDDRSGNRKRKNPSDDFDCYFEAEENDEGKIKVMTDNGKIISLPVKGLDTIARIKLQIMYVEGISCRNQELIFEETLLQDTNTLGNLCIKKGSTLKLIRNSKGFMKIFIKSPGPCQVTSSLEVKPSDTIRNVKAKMLDHRIGDVLIFNEIVLEDNDTLADFNIINGSTLTGVNISVKSMEIFVNSYTGKTICLFVRPTDTIANVKSEINYHERIPVDEQVLIFNNVVLGDSGTVLELAKTISILLVVDDIFDTYGSYDDLILFTKAIQRWDLDEMEQLPEYMKICYMALYNTTNDICCVVQEHHGLSVLPYLRKSWIDTIQAFMVEAEWVKRGNEPNLKDYIENGITTAGTYMALVHLFFLIGEGVTAENTSYLVHSYPRFFTDAGKILRLWDDLGTSKEEQERGHIASSIQLLMREKNMTSEEDGRKHILQLIQNSWKELNEALVEPNIFPLSIITVALNMSRASQVVYQHDDDNSYFLGVDDHARSLFFTPIDI